MQGNDQGGWWKGTFPSWIVLGLISVISLMGNRYLAHVETQLQNHVTIKEFQDYQRMHRELSDEVARRHETHSRDIELRLTRIEERQERILEIITNKP